LQFVVRTGGVSYSTAQSLYPFDQNAVPTRIATEDVARAGDGDNVILYSFNTQSLHGEQKEIDHEHENAYKN
jgi:hypothetical protein